MQHASRFFMWPGGRTHAQLPFLQRSLQEGRKRMLLHHEKVDSHELKSIPVKGRWFTFAGTVRHVLVIAQASTPHPSESNLHTAGRLVQRLAGATAALHTGGQNCTEWRCGPGLGPGGCHIPVAHVHA